MGICSGRAIVLQGYKQSLRFAATIENMDVVSEFTLKKN